MVGTSYSNDFQKLEYCFNEMLWFNNFAIGAAKNIISTSGTFLLCTGMQYLMQFHRILFEVVSDCALELLIRRM